MSKKEKNVGFTCISCYKKVLPIQNGSFRNHCPFCLHSLHVDNIIGDRRSECKGIMLPLRLQYNSKKGWQIVHRCVKCGIEIANKIGDGEVQPDDWDTLLRLIG